MGGAGLPARLGPVLRPAVAHHAAARDAQGRATPQRAQPARVHQARRGHRRRPALWQGQDQALRMARGIAHRHARGLPRQRDGPLSRGSHPRRAHAHEQRSHRGHARAAQGSHHRVALRCRALTPHRSLAYTLHLAPTCRPAHSAGTPHTISIPYAARATGPRRVFVSSCLISDTNPRRGSVRRGRGLRLCRVPFFEREGSLFVPAPAI
mmetsp:Transcript_22417/g.57062  ORF Transcript_22417/g.57062 Transcript_22417/m.57062 type:complete len:209 (+) Transcript_22417:505-1131(+)